jgi:putative membrane protein
VRMIHLLLSWAILTGAVLLTSLIMKPVIRMRSWKTAIWVAAMFGVLQTLFLRFLVFLTFPAWVLTFGLFTFVLQAFLLWVTDKALSDIQIKSFGWTIVAAFLISLLDRFGHFLLG